MIPKAKLSTQKIKKIIKHFCTDIDATKTSELLDLNPNTIDRYFGIFRQIIYENRMRVFKEKIGGKIEVDESYFGAKRKRGFAGKLKRGRGTLKQPVFGLIKRKDENGRVEIYTEIIPNCKADTLRPIIQGKVNFDESILYSDGWRGYNGLVDTKSERHYRVSHGDHEFSKGNGIHINGIENFWSFTKRRLSRLYIVCFFLLNIITKGHQRIVAIVVNTRIHQSINNCFFEGAVITPPSSYVNIHMLRILNQRVCPSLK